MSRSSQAAATARKKTKTKAFGTGKRESHDSSAYYDRKLVTVDVSKDTTCSPSPVVDRILCKSAETMDDLVDNSIALMVTSPPYHVGKEYDADYSFDDYLSLLRRVFGEVHRVLEPGGRAVVNVANLGRRPYIPLTSHINMLMLDLGFLMRGEIVWRKAKADSGSCAWGTWRKADNPVLRDVHEYLLVFSKGRFGRARKGDSTLSADEFRIATTSVWDDIRPESAKRVGHPAPFPVELPERLIRLYSFVGDVILDPFMGAGSTALAAIRNDRHFVGYEIAQEYVELAERRLQAERDELD
jgi:site-specific DNA-methyltransferase (adenine-specific)